jgi:phenylalanyl-tRNA synthetase alpha chain
MKDQIEKCQIEINAIEINSALTIEEFRLKYLSKKGILSLLFDEFKTVDPSLRKEVGQALNNLKNFAQEKLNAAQNNLLNNSAAAKKEDLTKPGSHFPLGAKHPLNIARKRINDIFLKIGYVITEGPEIEDDWHNFSALNFPPEHPARDMQDTFFIDAQFALRTHTSSVQVRVMESSKPPIRTIAPGRVFRNEAISARAHCQFHQVEVLYIDKGVSFAELKQTLLYFARELFGKHTNIRLRPSYFPFTEPSAEMDVSCPFCSDGCNICKGTKWVEILGCGMVDPNVLKNCGIDPQEFSGFAFGMGIERIAMLLYGVNDLRLFFENDVKFLEQFSGAE